MDTAVLRKIFYFLLYFQKEKLGICLEPIWDLHMENPDEYKKDTSVQKGTS